MLTIDGNTFRWGGVVVGYFTPPQHLDSLVRDVVNNGDEDTYSEEQVAALLRNVQDIAKRLEHQRETLRSIIDSNLEGVDSELDEIQTTLNDLDVEDQ
jgi:cystathionine beta-lyase/cystathionine gamma-synthase